MASNRNSMISKAQQCHKYSAVAVLIMFWDNDTGNFASEAEGLTNVLVGLYGYHVKIGIIPSQNPDQWMEKTLLEFLQTWDSPDNLLIVHYGGHGSLNKARQQLWHCTDMPNEPEIRWYANQRHLETARSDVLLLLDCCYASGTSGNVTPKTFKEVIAASSFGHTTPGVGPGSLTYALITELTSCYRTILTGQGLFDAVRERLMHLLPVDNEEISSEPVHYMMGGNRTQQGGIELLSYVEYPLNLVAITGTTGVGKSSFINSACGRELCPVGTTKKSMTKEIQSVATFINQKSVTLIDTPGFNDTFMSEADILRTIARHLQTRYAHEQKLTGIIFLKDIHSPKMMGSDTRDFAMICAICGDDFTENLVLVTNKWDKYSGVDPDELEDAEREFSEDFWGDQMSAGSRRYRCYRNQGQEQSILADMISFTPKYVLLQREIADHCRLKETTAGKIVDDGASLRYEKAQERIVELEQKLAAATSEKEKDVLVTQRERSTQAQIREKANKRRLEVTGSELIQEEEIKQSRTWDRMIASCKQWFEDLESDKVRMRSPEESMRAKEVRKQTKLYASLGTAAAAGIGLAAVVLSDDN